MVGRLILSLFLCMISPRQAHAMAQDDSISTHSGMRVLSQGATEFGILIDTSYNSAWFALGHLMPILHDFSDLHVNLFLPLKNDTEMNCVRPGEYHDQNSPRRCSNLCTNEGRYCCSGNVLGSGGPLMIEDSLDLVCLWQLYAYSEDPSPLHSYLNAQAPYKYDEYGVSVGMTSVARCLYDNGTDREKASACRHDIMTAAGVDVGALEACIVSSGGLETGPNSLLERSINGTIDTMPAYRGGVSISGTPQALCAQSNEDTPAICATCHEDACRNQLACWNHSSCIDDICQQCDYDPVCWKQGTCPSGDESTPVSPGASIDYVPPDKTPSAPNGSHENPSESKSTKDAVSSLVDYRDNPTKSYRPSSDHCSGKFTGLDMGVTFFAGMAVALLLMAMYGRLQERSQIQHMYKVVDTPRSEVELT